MGDVTQLLCFFFSSRRRHTRCSRDWSSDVCSSDLNILPLAREVARALDKEPREFELVFVDDASRDGTWEKIREARRLDARVRGARHARNSGQSAALWTGIQATRGGVIATLDGDLQNDPSDLPKLLA